MFNYQIAILNECGSNKSISVLKHYFSAYSLTIEHCALSIAKRV